MSSLALDHCLHMSLPTAYPCTGPLPTLVLAHCLPLYLVLAHCLLVYTATALYTVLAHCLPCKSPEPSLVLALCLQFVLAY